mgnify:FL=1
MQLKKIKVYGKLRKFLGQSTFEAAVSSPEQAFNFLKANFAGFESHMRSNFYKVKMNGNVITQDLLSLKGQGEIQIIPVAVGSDFVFDFIGDAFNFVVSNALPFVLAFTTGGLGNLLLTVGLTLATELLSNNRPTQNQSSVGDTDPNIRGSYNFSGIQNVSTSGVPVPILYGYVFSGSILISAGVDTVQLVSLITDEGTYGQSGNRVTVFINNHGLSNGESIRLDFLTGPLAGSNVDVGARFGVENVTTNTFETSLGQWNSQSYGNSADNTVKITERNPN